MKSIFKKTTKVDAKSGKTVLSVTVNGKECETFALEGKTARRHAGLSLIYMDLLDALWWLQKAYSLFPSKKKSKDQEKITTRYVEINDKDMFKTVKAYFYSSVITYGKCFASTDKRGVKLETKKHVEDRYKPCHDKIINFRNNLVAHAGGVFDGGEVIVAPNPIGPEFHVTPNLWRLDFEDDRELSIGFEELILHMKDKVDKMREKTLSKLLNDDAKEAIKEHRQ
jgi:hypothetical protein